MAGRHGRPWKRLFVRIVCVDILPFWFVLGWYVVLLSGPSAFGVSIGLLRCSRIHTLGNRRYYLYFVPALGG